MGAIVGLIGEGSLSEVQMMAERMPHRGKGIHVWSPAPRVYFGCRGPVESRAPQLAADADLDEHSLLDVATMLGSNVNALREISGYFSLAYWDDAHQRVVLACDTAPFKSLYYVELEGRIAFASEYKALLALPDVRALLDVDAAQYYLATRSFRMDRPLLKGVRPLPAGGVLNVSGKQVTHSTYWSFASRIERRSRAEFALEVRATLESVTRRQASRFSRVGITLSGGLDSACVLALLKHVRPDLHVASYTIGFGAQDLELQGGRELARLFGTQHHELTFDPACIPQHLPQLVWLMEDCAGREEALLQQLVLAEAARAEQVVFGGYGADVLFAGMPRYRLLRLRDALPGLRKPLAEIYQYTQTGAPPRTVLGRLGCRLLGRDRFVPPLLIGASGPARVPDDLPLDEYIASQMDGAQDSGYIEPALAIGNLSFRDPFQSTEMMDLALRIPGRYDVGPLAQKMILRAAVADLLPPRVASRGKSLQRVRHDAALSDVLEHMGHQLLDAETVRARGLVSMDYVHRLLDRSPGERYSTDRLYRLWTMLCLELWQRQFIDHRGASGAVVERR